MAYLTFFSLYLDLRYYSKRGLFPNAKIFVLWINHHMCEKIRHGYIFYIVTVYNATSLALYYCYFYYSVHFIAVDDTALFRCKETSRERMRTFLNLVHHHQSLRNENSGEQRADQSLQEGACLLEEVLHRKLLISQAPFARCVEK